MRTRPRREPVHALPLAVLAGVVTLVLIAAGGRGAGPAADTSIPSWKGLAGELRPRVAVGQRMIVVLKAPALADRLGPVGGLATGEQERQWNSAALASQKLLISRLGVEGVPVQPEYSYTRAINGFSAAFDANGLALLERAPEVAGVYPVRAMYPASAGSVAQPAPTFGRPPQVGLSSEDGRGVTVAVLDTGVDRAQPFLRGRITGGVDIVGGSPGADAAHNPDAPAELERHGTEMAGLVVGSGGPGGMAGIAPGASVLPIRVAGWQRDASARWAVYARTDQLLAGLERAVDPNGDGDAHDAARIALIALSEPFGGFDDGPLARAAAGALRLDTLVVAPAGNDGAAGPAFGSISGPGGAAAALTVGAADLRSGFVTARVVVRAGLAVELDRVVPLAGSLSPGAPVDAAVAVPRDTVGREPAGSVPLIDFFDPQGRNLVAGRAALVPVGSDPAGTFENAARAGARAVLFYGGAVPAGALGTGEAAEIPAVSIPADTARTLLTRLHGHVPVSVSIGAKGDRPSSDDHRVAEFSSTGLAFDGRVKPEVVAPGVGLGTAEPGTAADGSARYGTVNGTSAAAAVVAGDAALLTEARPDLDAESLKGLLVGSARPFASDPITAQGAGLVDVGGAAATEVTASPASLAVGRATSTSWRLAQRIQLRNVSLRRLRLDVSVDVANEGAAAVDFTVRPQHFFLGPGRTINIHVRAHVTSAIDGDAPLEGNVVVQPVAGAAIHVPWVLTFGPPLVAALSAVRLSSHSFRPSDVKPALLSFVAGAVPKTDSGQDVRPLALVDLELWSPTGGRIGLLARMRDVLPGRYSYGVTGRDPTGQVLPSSDYVLRLVGYPTAGGKPTVRTVKFRIE
ncbi:MAG: S8 family serine peptidase [Gaiellaceae bacterium]